MTSTPADQPEYACAILADPAGRLLLHLRPPDARRAPGQLTCFGGRREPAEDSAGCLARELGEELGWIPTGPMAVACDLRRGPRWIARFYHVALEVPLGALRPAPGHHPLAIPWPTLPGLPISPWHRAALAAVRQGLGVVEV